MLSYSLLRKILVACSLCFSACVYAHQAVDVSEPVNEEKPRTSHWVTETDEVDIVGAPGALKSDAMKNWEAACDKWKKEFREDNKDSKIFELNCRKEGKLPTCSGDVSSKFCVSKGVWKMKTREDN